jgi:hypothetical protein
MANMQRAYYRKYVGNHPDGRNQAVYNKYGYPMPLIVYLSSLGREDVHVYGNEGDGFSRLISVDATQKTWEEAWVLLAREMGNDVWFDDIEEDEDGSLWGRTRGVYSDDPDEITELIYQDGRTELQLVQDGYIPVAEHNGKTLWMECQEIAKTT